jgi:hypothetical protein
MDKRVFSPHGALPPLSLYAFNADMEDVTLFFMADQDYDPYSIPEDKVHFFKLQITLHSNNFRASGVTVIHCQPAQCP